MPELTSELPIPSDSIVNATHSSPKSKNIEILRTLK